MNSCGEKNIHLITEVDAITFCGYHYVQTSLRLISLENVVKSHHEDYCIEVVAAK